MAGGGHVRLQSHITVHQCGKSGQEPQQGSNLEAGADAEAMEGAAHWLVPHGLLSLFCYTAHRTTCPSMALHTMDWALSHPFSIKKMATVLPTSDSHEGMSQLMFPFLR